MQKQQPTRSRLESQFKRIFSDIRINYSQFLQSLKFQNFEDRRKIKGFQKKIKKLESNQSINDDEEEYEAQEMVKKKFQFEEEMAQENKGRIASIKLMQSIKELNELNTKIFLYELENREQSEIRGVGEFTESLKQLEFSICQNFHDPYR